MEILLMSVNMANPNWKYEVWDVLSTKYYLQEHLMSNFCVLLRFRHDFDI